MPVSVMIARYDPGPGPKIGTKHKRRVRLLPDPVGELHIALVQKLKLEGRSDEDVAEFLGVGRRTLNRWKNEVPAFRKAFVEIREVVAARALSKLAELALGGVDTVTVVTVEGEKPKRITTRSKTQPDFKALTYQLAIADPSKYALNKIYNGAGKDDDASLAHTRRDMEALIGMLPVDREGVLKLTAAEVREAQAEREALAAPDQSVDPTQANQS
jgi:hypothetical protein